MKIKDIIRKVGVSRRHYNNLVSGAANASSGLADRFEKLLSCNAEIWMHPKHASKRLAAVEKFLKRENEKERREIRRKAKAALRA